MVKNLPGNARARGDVGSTPGLGRCPGGGHGNPLQYSCLQNPMVRGAWQSAIHRVTQSRRRLKQLSSPRSNTHLTVSFSMATLFMFYLSN